MKKILAALLCSCSWCGFGFAQTAEELLHDGRNTENVTTFGMGYDLKMYSPLKEIDKSNVRRLVPIWSFSLANDMGEHSQPTIYNGVMYVSTATGRLPSTSRPAGRSGARPSSTSAERCASRPAERS